MFFKYFGTQSNVVKTAKTNEGERKKAIERRQQNSKKAAASKKEGKGRKRKEKEKPPWGVQTSPVPGSFEP